MKQIFKKSFLLSFLFLGLVSCEKEDDTPAFQTSESQVALVGEDNMRDLGGYVSSNGKHVLYGNLYRSGELNGLTTEDVAKLSSLGIRRVIDLRTETEMTEKPDHLPTGVVNYHLSLLADIPGSSTSQQELMGQIMSGTVLAEDYMLPLYTLDSQKITNFRAIFDLLQSGGTTLWHCTAGKDRAGMTTALVLSALDVPRETIVQDFMKSNDYLSSYINGTVSYLNSTYGPGIGDKMIPMLGVEQIYIEAFFNDIETKYGSVNNFLTNELKVDKSKMKKLYLEK